MIKFLNTIIDIIYPKRCIFCNNIINFGEKEIICSECIQKLPFINTPYCIICGMPVKDENTKCKRCINEKHFYKKAFSVFEYKGVVKDAIHRFKFENHPEYAFILGNFMAEKFYLFNDFNIDYIICVPMHIKREKYRTYNQAYLLSKVISEKTNIPLLNNVLLRIKNTKQQSKLNSVFERSQNIKDAFSVSDRNIIKNKNILLVDDVYTSGNTIDECSKMLTLSEVSNVYCFTLSKVVQGDTD